MKNEDVRRSVSHAKGQGYDGGCMELLFAGSMVKTVTVIIYWTKIKL